MICVVVHATVVPAGAVFEYYCTRTSNCIEVGLCFECEIRDENVHYRVSLLGSTTF